MKKRQQIVIFAIVGVMALSVIGTALLVATGGDGSTHSTTSDELDEELQAQLDQLEAQQEAQSIAQSCPSLPLAAGATALPLPEVETFADPVAELQITDITVGTGTEVKAGDCVVAHYHGTLATDGTVFDSSYERGSPARFSLAGVIQGWQNGVPGMKEGGVRQLVIPAAQAYGEAGSPPVIGPNADLVFTVEIVSIEADTDS